MIRRGPLVLTSLLACGGTPERNGQPKVPITPPAELCRDRSLTDESFCLDAERIEGLLERDDFLVERVEGPGRGTTEVKVLTIVFDDGGKKIRMRAKFKPSAPGGEGFNNSPRRETAAYELQKLFLEPDEYVVPPTRLLCIPLDRFENSFQGGEATPTFEGTRCVMGVMTYWIEHVTDRRVLRSDRFRNDGEYRRAIADLNLFTYLIDHHDVHDGNFLISTDRARPRAFSIDNGLAFSGIRNPMPKFRGQPDWAQIIVPSLPHEKIEALRRIRRAQLDALGTAAQFVVRGDLLVSVEPTPALDHDHGVRVKNGVIQFGLKKKEIDSVEERINEVLRRVDEREVAQFE